MPIEEYLAGKAYENLIKKSFSGREGEEGGSADYFQNLYRAERAEPNGLQGSTYRNHFDDIKDNLLRAIKELQKRGLNTIEFLAIEERIRSCSTVKCLANQVKYATALLAIRDSS